MPTAAPRCGAACVDSVDTRLAGRSVGRHTERGLAHARLAPGRGAPRRRAIILVVPNPRNAMQFDISALSAADLDALIEVATKRRATLNPPIQATNPQGEI